MRAKSPRDTPTKAISNVLFGPLLTRELVVQPRRPQLFLARGVYVTAVLVLMSTAWLVLAGTQLVRNVGDLARFGSMLFQILAPLQLALLAFQAALTSASAVAQEKDKKTLLLLLMTQLANRELVLGKLLGSMLPVLSMLLASAPVMVLLTLLGGVGTSQVFRVMVVTLVTMLAAGSLGSTVALAREKTFQALSVTALVMVLWIGLFEAIALVGTEVRLGGGFTLADIGQAASPLRAILSAAHPYSVTRGLLATNEIAFVIVALTATVLLNVLAIARLRVWNPGREMQSSAATTEPEFSSKTLLGEAAAAGDVSDEQARSTHVDARVRSINRTSRQVWDNPILWREACTWAYGRKVIVVRVAYLLLFVGVVFGLYQTVASGQIARPSDAAGIVPPAVRLLAPFCLVSLVIVNALAVNSITNERDGGALDLLLVTDLSPLEFIVGKLGGVAWVTKEMILLPVLLLAYLSWSGGLSLQNFCYASLGLLLMSLFVMTLGIHCGLNYASSRTAIGVSLGTVFFLFLGVVTLILLMISFSSSFQTQLAPFLAFIVGGSVGLFVTLGNRNQSQAIALSSLMLPFATFFAITSFLLGHWLQVFLVVAFTYGFTTVSMLIPAISSFDVAMGRTKSAGDE